MVEDQQTSTSVGQAASQTAGKVADAAGQATAAVGQAAAPAMDQVQETAGQVAEQAKQQALTQIGTQKEHAAGSLDAVAQALRQSGDHLRDQQQEPLANLAGAAAGRVEQFSGYLRNTDAKDMLRDVEGFARRQPAAFLGGAFTLGVLAARFLKSSARPDTDQQGADSPGRSPSYPGLAAGPASTSGAGRYPTRAQYPAPDAGSSSARSWLAPDSPTGGDPGSVDPAMPDPDLRGTPSGASAGGSAAASPGGSATAAPSSGAVAPGWGAAARRGGAGSGGGAR
jgi:hypothetical protein